MRRQAVARARWRRLDVAGSDICVLSRVAGGWRLDGKARVGAETRLAYAVHCDGGFATQGAAVRGWHEARRITLQVVVEGGVWRLDGAEQVEVAGLLDLDLAFTPATNLLPLRRLEFPPEREITAPAAWLAFPEKRLAPLEQVYARLSDDVFHYRAPGLGYAADLRVHPSGFVTDYPGFWQGEVHDA